MSTPDIEQRTICHAVELRSSGGKREIGGYASVFNSRSEPLPGGFREIVAPTMWNKSRGDGYPGVVCRYDHDSRMLIGTTASGTLRLAIDDVGLDYSCSLPMCRDDVLEMVSRKDVQNSSFAFQVIDDTFEY